MKKELLIATSPINGYTIHAYPLSIMLNYEKTKAWFYSNYIQVVCNPDYEENFFDFHTLCSIINNDIWIDSIYPGNPWIKCDGIAINNIDNYTSKVCDILKWVIDNDKYVITHLDDFYISQKENYNSKHNFHEILCFGYDDKKNIFKMLGYTNDGKFKEFDVTFEEFIISFKSSKSTFKILSVDNNFNYDLDIGLIYDSLECFLKSKDNLAMRRMIRNVNPNLVYGLNTYELLVNYYSTEREQYDIRPLHILWEHKKCMVMRLEYLSKIYINTNFNNLKNEYLELEKKALITKKLIIKFMISNKQQFKQKVIESIISMKEIEIKLTEEFMNLIKDLR